MEEIVFWSNDEDVTFNVEKPKELNKMLEISSNLSKTFQYVRVDLYIMRDKIYFGELTFYNNGGISDYKYDSDVLIGSLWTIKE